LKINLASINLNEKVLSRAKGHDYDMFNWLSQTKFFLVAWFELTHSYTQREAKKYNFCQKGVLFPGATFLIIFIIFIEPTKFPGDLKIKRTA